MHARIPSLAGLSHLVAALGLAIVGSGGAAAHPPGESTVSFRTGEILSLPTRSSVTLSLLPAEEADLVVAYGLAGEPTRFRTGPQHVLADELAVFRLIGLEPGHTYGYQVFCKPAGVTTWGCRPELQFSMSADDSFSFAFVTDTHAYTAWTQHACPEPGDTSTAFERVLATRDNLIADGAVDFVVLGGDYAMTRCGQACRPCVVAGQPVGGATVGSQIEADLRYQQILSDEIFGPLFRIKPFVNVLGNHEGEYGFSGGQFMEHSTLARLGHLPNPHDVYGGDPLGRYYSFTVGPVRIIVLDVMANTLVEPMQSGDWTLGPEQMAWLERTLERSDSDYNLIFQEHLLGGEWVTNGVFPSNPYYYGRGSLRATWNDSPTGPFKGEQEQVHQLMKQHGAQVAFLCHDHVAIIGEKLDETGFGEGIYFVTGGSASAGAPWTAWDSFRSEMDFDVDGVPEFETNVTGTTERGYFRITVQYDGLLLEYVRTDLIDASLNGKVLLTHLVPRSNPRGR